MTFTTITRCRACRDERLDTVLDLGNLAISDFLEPGQALERAPLTLVRCGGCGLVQLRDTVDRDRLYQRYWYRSGVNETMVAALRDVVADASRWVDLHPGDAVLDVGSNDGSLLSFYPETLHRIGFDPSDVAREAWIARDFAYDLVRDYFPTTRQHVPVPCKVITAVAMFYDLDDPGRFLDEVTRWLHPEGVLVIQLQDLAAMLAANAIDNACAEHVTYWDKHTLVTLAARHGLALCGSSREPINGGSRRLTFRHASAVPLPLSPGQPIAPEALVAFRERVVGAARALRALLERLRDEGRTVHGIAASTKWGTLSQYAGIGPDLIAAIGERSPAKVGKRTVTGIPICSEEEMRAARPDYLVACAWQFADAFAERERELLESGTKLIVPLPALRIVEGAYARV